MNSAAVHTEQQLVIQVEHWDALCAYFKDSVMAKANLCSLASDLGLKWPIRGKNETPERYIQYSLEELADLPEFYGKGNRLPLLSTILLETKQLDDPFLEMTEHLEKVVQKEVEEPPLLRQLGVPADFPVSLMNFSDKTLKACREGGYETLSQLVAFLQKSASAVMLNEEFRQFRNALDAAGLGKFLPIRDGSKGIHLAEAIGHLAGCLSDQQAATLLYAYKISTTNPAWKESTALGKTEALALFGQVKATAEKHFELLPEQAGELREAVQSGLTACVRYFVSLNDSDIESVAIAIAMAAFEVKPRLKGLLSNLMK